MNCKHLLTILSVLIYSILVFSQAEKKTAYSKDSVKIIFLDEGKGDPALVFVHGLSINKSYWREQTEKFSKSYRVITMDLAGHGESGNTRENYSVEAYGEDVAAVVNSVNPEKVILIGHSMGGAIIIEAAELLKGKVIGLIGVDTYHDLQVTYPQAEIDNFVQMFKTDFKNATKEFVHGMFPQNADPVIVAKVENDFVNSNPKIAVNTLENVFSYNEQENIKDIQIPIISINADLFPTNIEGNKKFTDFSVKIIKGVGHFPMIENEEAFNKCLEEAFEELKAKK
jgi:pimeloyl-ACP methyl ester carboxylesterase